MALLNGKRIGKFHEKLANNKKREQIETTMKTLHTIGDKWWNMIRIAFFTLRYFLGGWLNEWRARHIALSQIDKISCEIRFFAEENLPVSDS